MNDLLWAEILMHNLAPGRVPMYDVPFELLPQSEDQLTMGTLVYDAVLRIASLHHWQLLQRLAYLETRDIGIQGAS